MGGLSNTVTAPANSSSTTAYSTGRPWATAIVFKSDKNNSNQHIWNLGEGAGSTDDNIYLRTDSAGRLYFGWGRSGALNECLVRPQGTNVNWTVTSSNWYGVYIAHNGTRLSGANATATNLSDAFDIRLMGSSDGFSNTNLGYNISNSSNWLTTGGRMDRTVSGDFTIGGRGANRNFHGKVASMVITSLKLNTAMPNNAEIEMMITDPMQWLQDYKVGSTFRNSANNNQSNTFAIGNSTSGWATQVWLMGDGTNDSYSNMIRNQVQVNDQNYTKLNMISMVSNDIQNVNINGLT